MDKSCQCDKTCSHQSNITHHSRTCKSIRKKKVCKCKKCSKTFFCNCHLQAHLKNHLKKCDICNQQSRKVDLLNEHRLQCAGVNDEQFENYFTCEKDLLFVPIKICSVNNCSLVLTLIH